MILIPLLFIILAMIYEGGTHAILYSGKAENAFNRKEHTLFNFERINWGLIGGGSMILGIYNALEFSELKYIAQQSAIDFVTLGIVSWLMLSFFHNGAYGITLAKINDPEKSWWQLRKFIAYESNHDQAKFSEDWGNRVYFALFAILLIITNLLTRGVCCS